MDRTHAQHIVEVVGLLTVLLCEDCILCGFGDTELHDGFGRDLNLFARGGIAAHTGCPVNHHEFANARNRELVPCFFVCER